MKKIIVLFFLLISVFSSFSQPRVNDEVKYTVLSSSGMVENPVGWCYNYDGKWCGYYGVICGIYKRNSKIPINLSVYDKSFFEDNIISLQFKKIKSDNNDYYALYVIKYSGTYDYPIIKEGWHYRKICNVFLFTKEEYGKLYNLTEGINVIESFAHSTTTPYLSYQTQEGKNELNSGLKRIFDDVNEDYIYNSLNPKFGLSSRWYIKMEEDGKTIRFCMPCCEKYIWEEAQKINAQNKTNGSTFREISRYDCIDFAKNYFECSLIKFKQLLI